VPRSPSPRPSSPEIALALGIARLLAAIGPILLYLGWTPEGKNPWITLKDEDAEAVIRWLAARDLAYGGQTT
jgi:hypothetical protein